MQTESLWTVDTISASLTINNNYGDRVLDINFKALFSRRTLLSIRSFQAICASRGGYRALIEPGEFVLAQRDTRGKCACCPCSPELDFNPLPPVACGTETYTDPGIEDKTLFGEVTILDIIPKNCRPGYVDPSYYFIDEEGPYFTDFVPATLAISAVIEGVQDLVNEEQTVIAGGGTFFFGSAVLKWTNPDGWIVDIALAASLGPSFMGHNFTAVASFTPPPPEDPQPETDPVEGLEISLETNGIRVAFTGQYAGLAVGLIQLVSNDVTTRDFLSPLNLPSARMVATFLIREGAPNGPDHSTWSVSLPISGRCPKNYTGSAPIGFAVSGEYIIEWS